MFCAFCGRHIDEGQRYCLHCGAEDSGISRHPRSANKNSSGVQEGQENQIILSMKWYEFLIHFFLYFDIIVCALAGLSVMSGAIHEARVGIQAEVVYSMYESLKAIDVMCGLALFAMSVLGFVARNRLARFRFDGPIYVFSLFATGAIVSLGYTLLVSAVTELEVIDLSVVLAIVVQTIMALANKTYFEKRAKLFIR